MTVLLTPRFEPICYLVNSPTVIVVNSASPYRTLAGLLDAARAKPGDLTVAGSGFFFIAFEMLKRVANLNMTFVPYPGGAPAVTAACSAPAALRNRFQTGQGTRDTPSPAGA